jgi:hypothetical protein
MREPEDTKDPLLGKYRGPDGQLSTEGVAVAKFKQYVMDMPRPVAALAIAAATKKLETEPGDSTFGIFLEIEEMVTASTELFVVEVLKSLPEKDREALAQLIADRLRKPQSLDQVQATGRSAIKLVIEQLVANEINAGLEVQRARIAKLVADAWESEVGAIVRKKLADAVAKVKAEFAR